MRDGVGGAGLIGGYRRVWLRAEVSAGFTCGIALVIAAGRLGKLPGVPVEGDGFLDRTASAPTRSGEAHLLVVVVAATTVVLLLLRRKPRRPGPLIAVTLTTADDGVARRGATLRLTGLNVRPRQALRRSGRGKRLRGERRVHDYRAAAVARLRTG